MLQQTRAHSETTGIMSPTPYSIPNPQVSSGEPQQFDANDSDILMSSSDEISRGSQQPPPGMTAPSVILSPVLSHGEAHANSDLNMSSNLNLASSVRHVVRKLENTHHIYSKSSLTQLELEPTQCLFEWDERTSDVGDDGSADGMGILPNESDMGGYLGKRPSNRNQKLPSPGNRCHIRSRPVTLDRCSARGRVSATHSYKPPPFTSGFSFYICTAGQLCRCIFSDVSHMLSVKYLRAIDVDYKPSANVMTVHEPTFRAQLMEVIPRPSHQAWQVLLYVIAALGAFSSATQSTDSDIILFKEAEKRFSVDMLRTGNILLVQATTLMANYLQKRNRPNSGYNYLGLARRMAMGIGLHKELDHSSASLLQQEEKRRTWWCLFVFDSGMTITLSRPMDLPNGGIEVNLPLNVHDSVSSISYDLMGLLLKCLRISQPQLLTWQILNKRQHTLTCAPSQLSIWQLPRFTPRSSPLHFRRQANSSISTTITSDNGLPQYLISSPRLRFKTPGFSLAAPSSAGATEIFISSCTDLFLSSV